jgi:hypothetical protein
MIRNRFIRRPLSIGALLGLTIFAGCVPMSAVDKPRDESFTKAAGFDRKDEDNKSTPWGVSSRSRDIERDLGVR